MDTRTKYLRYAEECKRLAKNATPNDRAILLELAQLWNDYAEGKRKVEGENQDGADG